jgi:hypothetical protein
LRSLRVKRRTGQACAVGWHGEEYFSGQAAERGEGGLRLDVRDVSNVTASFKAPASRSVELLSTLAGHWHHFVVVPAAENG